MHHLPSRRPPHHHPPPYSHHHDHDLEWHWNRFPLSLLTTMLAGWFSAGFVLKSILNNHSWDFLCQHRNHHYYFSWNSKTRMKIVLAKCYGDFLLAANRNRFFLELKGNN